MPELEFSNSAKTKNFSFTQRLREISMFFEGKDRVHQTMRRVAGRMEAAGIHFAIVGGMAVNAHRHERTTGDVDFLVSQQAFEHFVKLTEEGEFARVPGRPRRFIDSQTGVTFDFLVAGMFPGSGKPGPIVYPDPQAVVQTIENLPVVDLRTLIQLKLAAGRHQDFADVVNLIGVHGLDEKFADQLEPSVRRDYIECLEERRREEEYETRQDILLEEKTDHKNQPPKSS